MTLRVISRVMLANELPWLGGGGRGVIKALDVAWAITRGVVWTVTVPWSMMVSGVKGPGAFKKGARGPIRSSLARLFRRDRDVGDLDALEAAPDDASASLVGIVRVIDPLPRAPASTVWLRVDAILESVEAMTERWHVVFEEAMDFELEVDAARPRVRILAAGGFLVAEPGHEDDDISWTERVKWPWPRLQRTGVRVVNSGRRTIQDGAKVRIVGSKARIVDPTIEERLGREAPLRTALATTKKQPLLVFVE